MNKPFRKIISLFVLTVFVVGQIILAPLAEASIWDERRKSIELAAFPTTPSFPKVSIGNPVSLKTLDPRLKISGMTTKKISPVSSLAPLMQHLSLQHLNLQEIYSPIKPAGAPVLLLQDIHLNVEAQSNLSSALLQLIEGKQIGLIGVEGAFGPLNFKPFQPFDPSLRRFVAESYLKANRLAAPSYVGIVSEAALPAIVGIDDRDHYDKNVQAYLKSRGTAISIGKTIEKTKKRLVSDLSTKPSQPLSHLLLSKIDHSQGTITLGTYLNELRDHATNIDLAVEQFLEASEMERTLDFARVDVDRGRVLEALSKSLSKADLQKLLDASVAYKEGRLGFGDYYGYLRDLCQEHGVSLRATPAFDSYLRYVLLTDGIKAEKLFESLDRMESEAFASLAKTDTEQMLVADTDRLMLTEKLVSFSLTPREWKKYRITTKKHVPLPVRGEVRRGAPTPASSPHGEGNQHFEGLASFEQFYSETDIRTEKILENFFTTHRIPQTVSLPSAMVIGGFHSPDIAAKLKEKRIPFVIASPRVTKLDATSGNAYLSIFAREKTPLEKLFEGKKLSINPKNQNISFGPTKLDTFGSLLLQTIDASQQKTVRTLGKNQLIFNRGPTPAEDTITVSTNRFTRTVTNLRKVRYVIHKWFQSRFERRKEITRSWIKEHWKVLSKKYSIEGHNPKDEREQWELKFDYFLLHSLILSLALALAHLSPFKDIPFLVRFFLFLIPSYAIGTLPAHLMVNTVSVGLGIRSLTKPPQEKGISNKAQKDKFLAAVKSREKNFDDPRYLKLYEETQKRFDRYLKNVSNHLSGDFKLENNLAMIVEDASLTDQASVLKALSDRLKQEGKTPTGIFSSFASFKEFIRSQNMSDDLKNMLCLPSTLIHLFPPDLAYNDDIYVRSVEMTDNLWLYPETASALISFTGRLISDGFLEGSIMVVVMLRPTRRQKFLELNNPENLIYSLYEAISHNQNIRIHSGLGLFAKANPALRPLVMTAISLLLHDPKIKESRKIQSVISLAELIPILPSEYQRPIIEEIEQLSEGDPEFSARVIRCLISQSSDNKFRKKLIQSFDQLCRRSNNIQILGVFLDVLECFPSFVTENQMAYLKTLEQNTDINKKIFGVYAAVLNSQMADKSLKKGIQLSTERLFELAEDNSADRLSRQNAQLAIIRRSLELPVPAGVIDGGPWTIENRMQAIRTVSGFVQPLLAYSRENIFPSYHERHLPLLVAETIFDHLNESKNPKELEEMLKRYQEFKMMRVASWPKPLREELVQNRVLLAQGKLEDDVRPRVFCVFAKGDWNGALLNADRLLGNFKNSGHLILYEEVERPEEFKSVIDKFGGIDGPGKPHPAAQHVFAFHSQSKGGTLGRQQVEAERLTVDFSDRLKAQQLDRGLLPTGSVLVWGCYVAQTDDALDTSTNIKRMFIQAYPNRRILASKEETVDVILRESGEYIFIGNYGHIVKADRDDLQELLELDNIMLEIESELKAVIQTSAEIIRPGRLIVKNPQLYKCISLLLTNMTELNEIFNRSMGSQEVAQEFRKGVEELERKIPPNQKSSKGLVILLDSPEYFFFQKILGWKLELELGEDSLFTSGTILFPMDAIRKISSDELRQDWHRLEHLRLLGSPNNTRVQYLRNQLGPRVIDSLENSFNELLKISSFRVSADEARAAGWHEGEILNLTKWLVTQMKNHYGSSFNFIHFWVLLAEAEDRAPSEIKQDNAEAFQIVGLFWTLAKNKLQHRNNEEFKRTDASRIFAIQQRAAVAPRVVADLETLQQKGYLISPSAAPAAPNPPGALYPLTLFGITKDVVVAAFIEGLLILVVSTGWFTTHLPLGPPISMTVVFLSALVHSLPVIFLSLPILIVLHRFLGVMRPDGSDPDYSWSGAVEAGFIAWTSASGIPFIAVGMLVSNSVVAAVFFAMGILFSTVPHLLINRWTKRAGTLKVRRTVKEITSLEVQTSATNFNKEAVENIQRQSGDTPGSIYRTIHDQLSALQFEESPFSSIRNTVTKAVGIATLGALPFSTRAQDNPAGELESHHKDAIRNIVEIYNNVFHLHTDAESIIGNVSFSDFLTADDRTLNFVGNRVIPVLGVLGGLGSLAFCNKQRIKEKISRRDFAGLMIIGTAFLIVNGCLFFSPIKDPHAHGEAMGNHIVILDTYKNKKKIREFTYTMAHEIAHRENLPNDCLFGEAFAFLVLKKLGIEGIHFLHGEYSQDIATTVMKVVSDESKREAVIRKLVFMPHLINSFVKNSPEEKQKMILEILKGLAPTDLRIPILATDVTPITISGKYRAPYVYGTTIGIMAMTLHPDVDQAFQYVKKLAESSGSQRNTGQSPGAGVLNYRPGSNTYRSESVKIFQDSLLATGTAIKSSLALFVLMSAGLALLTKGSVYIGGAVLSTELQNSFPTRFTARVNWAKQIFVRRLMTRLSILIGTALLCLAPLVSTTLAQPITLDLGVTNKISRLDDTRRPLTFTTTEPVTPDYQAQADLHKERLNKALDSLIAEMEAANDPAAADVREVKNVANQHLIILETSRTGIIASAANNATWNKTKHRWEVERAFSISIDIFESLSSPAATPAHRKLLKLILVKEGSTLRELAKNPQLFVDLTILKSGFLHWSFNVQNENEREVFKYLIAHWTEGEAIGYRAMIGAARWQNIAMDDLEAAFNSETNGTIRKVINQTAKYLSILNQPDQEKANLMLKADIFDTHILTSFPSAIDLMGKFAAIENLTDRDPQTGAVIMGILALTFLSNPRYTSHPDLASLGFKLDLDGISSPPANFWRRNAVLLESLSAGAAGILILLKRKFSRKNKGRSAGAPLGMTGRWSRMIQSIVGRKYEIEVLLDTDQELENLPSIKFRISRSFLEKLAFLEEVVYAGIFLSVIPWLLGVCFHLDPILLHKVGLYLYIAVNLVFGFDHDVLLTRDKKKGERKERPARWYHQLFVFAPMGAFFRIGYVAPHLVSLMIPGFTDVWALPLALGLHGVWNFVIVPIFNAPMGMIALRQTQTLATKTRLSLIKRVGMTGWWGGLVDQWNRYFPSLRINREWKVRLAFNEEWWYAGLLWLAQLILPIIFSALGGDHPGLVVTTFLIIFVIVNFIFGHDHLFINRWISFKKVSENPELSRPIDKWLWFPLMGTLFRIGFLWPIFFPHFHFPWVFSYFDDKPIMLAAFIHLLWNGLITPIWKNALVGTTNYDVNLRGEPWEDWFGHYFIAADEKETLEERSLALIALMRGLDKRHWAPRGDALSKLIELYKNTKNDASIKPLIIHTISHLGLFHSESRELVFGELRNSDVPSSIKTAALQGWNLSDDLVRRKLLEQEPVEILGDLILASQDETLLQTSFEILGNLSIEGTLYKKMDGSKGYFYVPNFQMGEFLRGKRHFIPLLKWLLSHSNPRIQTNALYILNTFKDNFPLPDGFPFLRDPFPNTEIMPEHWANYQKRFRPAIGDHSQLPHKMPERAETLRALEGKRIIFWMSLPDGDGPSRQLIEDLQPLMEGDQPITDVFIPDYIYEDLLSFIPRRTSVNWVMTLFGKQWLPPKKERNDVFNQIDVTLKILKYLSRKVKIHRYDPIDGNLEGRAKLKNICHPIFQRYKEGGRILVFGLSNDLSKTALKKATGFLEPGIATQFLDELRSHVRAQTLAGSKLGDLDELVNQEVAKQSATVIDTSDSQIMNQTALGLHDLGKYLRGHAPRRSFVIPLNDSPVSALLPLPFLNNSFVELGDFLIVRRKGTEGDWSKPLDPPWTPNWASFPPSNPLTKTVTGHPIFFKGAMGLGNLRDWAKTSGTREAMREKLQHIVNDTALDLGIEKLSPDRQTGYWIGNVSEAVAGRFNDHRNPVLVNDQSIGFLSDFGHALGFILTSIKNLFAGNLNFFFTFLKFQTRSNIIMPFTDNPKLAVKFARESAGSPNIRLMIVAPNIDAQKNIRLKLDEAGFFRTIVVLQAPTLVKTIQEANLDSKIAAGTAFHLLLPEQRRLWIGFLEGFDTEKNPVHLYKMMGLELKPLIVEFLPNRLRDPDQFEREIREQA